LRELRTLFNLGAIGELTDGQLLERFATQGPEAAELAFAALVERHGPMVLRVCRSAFRDRHQADDAFQATFLVLVQKARSLWVKDSLGPWLHRVAHRIATRARHSEARRREHERRAAAMSPMLASEPDGQDERVALLHEEIDRLPERYRAPIVICDLQGLTHEKAARHLGWPVGTVKSRLARAREILRGRLSRRGLGLHAGLWIAGKGPAGALRAIEVVLPASLAESTVGAATALAADRAAGAISAGVTILIEQGLKTMFLNKLKLASIALLFFGAAAATTVGVLAQSRARPKPTLEEQNRPPASTALRGGRKSDSTPASESAPALITQSRATIVSILEEELAAARMQRDRALNRIGGHTDPAAIEAQKTVDALDHLVARIDEVLVDAVKAYPRMFDVSEGPAPVSSQNQSIDRSTRRPVDATKDPLAEQPTDAQLTRALDRLMWAQDMLDRGYVAKSVVDLERRNVSRLNALLKGKPADSVLPDRQQQPRGQDQSQSNSAPQEQGAKDAAKPEQSQGQNQQGKSGNSQQGQAGGESGAQAGGKSGAQEPQNQGQRREESNRSEQAPQRNDQKAEDSQDRPEPKAGQPPQSGDRQSPNDQNGQPGQSQSQQQQTPNQPGKDTNRSTQGSQHNVSQEQPRQSQSPHQRPNPNQRWEETKRSEQVPERNNQQEASNNDSKRQDAGPQPNEKNAAGSNDAKRQDAGQQRNNHQNKASSTDRPNQEAGQSSKSGDR